MLNCFLLMKCLDLLSHFLQTIRSYRAFYDKVETLPNNEITDKINAGIEELYNGDFTSRR